MGRDKRRDDIEFNCSQEPELKYVANLYSGHEKEIYEFLKNFCKTGLIHYSTHMEIYKLIEKTFGFPIPVAED